MSAVRKRLYYAWKKLSERQSREKFRKVFFKHDLERFKTSTVKKPAAQMKRELKALYAYWDCYPFQYYRHDFYREDCALTLDEMKTYVPLYFLHHLYFPLSYKDYGILCEDKLLTYATLKAYELPQPPLLFCYDNNTFFDSANNVISASETDAIIAAATTTLLFAKPRFGSEGKGISVFEKKGGQFRNEHQVIFDHNFFKSPSAEKIQGRDTSGYYIVQEGLTQHNELNHIYPHAVNTYRIITEYDGAHATVLFCVLRMGSGGRKIDNSSAGGIFVRVNIETGALYEAARAFDESTTTTHPDTGFVFKGATMQTWAAVKALALTAALKFRDIRYLGWDIAMTIDGPAIIEINNKPDIAHIQSTYGGARDLLKITPKDWWYQSNYTIKNI